MAKAIPSVVKKSKSKANPSDVIVTADYPEGYDRPPQGDVMLVPALVSCQDCGAIVFHHPSMVGRHNDWHRLHELTIQLTTGKK
jgi:hypothetical protein